MPKLKKEQFPNLKKWWTYEPESIMTAAYWHKKQLPPSNRKKYEQQWQSLKKQLMKKYPPPSSYKEGVNNTSSNELTRQIAKGIKSGRDQFAFNHKGKTWTIRLTKKRPNGNVDGQVFINGELLYEFENGKFWKEGMQPFSAQNY